MDITMEEVKNLRANGLSWNEIGEHFAADNENPYRVGERVRGLWRRYSAGEDSRCSKRENRDGSESAEHDIIQYDELALMTDDALLRSHGYDPRYWRPVEASRAIRGGKLSSRVKVVAKEIPELGEEELTAVLSNALHRMNMPYVKPTLTPSYGKTAVVALYDVHYGRRGTDGSGHLDTERTVMRTIQNLCNKFENNRPSQIILPIGQDFLNADNIQGATTKGTPQENSLSWHEMLAGGLALAIRVVDALCAYAPVKIIYNEGNHDRVLSYAVVKALEQRYENCPFVTVDTDLHPRKYILVKNTLIGLSHGSEESNLSTTMQVEAPREWGESTHRYWFIGHLHHFAVSEKDGVVMIQCPALTMADEWTRRRGFVGADIGMVCGMVGEDGLEDIWLMRP